MSLHRLQDVFSAFSMSWDDWKIFSHGWVGRELTYRKLSPRHAVMISRWDDIMGCLLCARHFATTLFPCSHTGTLQWRCCYRCIYYSLGHLIGEVTCLRSNSHSPDLHPKLKDFWTQPMACWILTGTSAILHMPAQPRVALPPALFSLTSLLILLLCGAPSLLAQCHLWATGPLAVTFLRSYGD